MTDNEQIFRHVCKAHRFHVACGPAIEAPLMTMVGPIPQGEAK
jgi:hypothetical protein